MIFKDKELEKIIKALTTRAMSLRSCAQELDELVTKLKLKLQEMEEKQDD